MAVSTRQSVGGFVLLLLNSEVSFFVFAGELVGFFIVTSAQVVVVGAFPQGHPVEVGGSTHHVGRDGRGEQNEDDGGDGPARNTQLVEVDGQTEQNGGDA